MATFIPNIGDVTPEIEYFRPNLELMASYLDARQGQFNAARDELNTMYNTLMSLDLTLDENKKRREDFFKAADQQIKKFANVDISLPENIAAAKRVFSPLVEDEAMSEDFLFTSKIKNIVTTAEKFKNSSEEEDRARYNPLSVQFAGLKQQEYINAAPEARSAIANSNMGYVSYVNLLEKATALAKEMDLGDIKRDVVTGGYKVTTTNGELLAPHLQSAFMQAFMQDPEVSAYYNQKAYVDVQTAISSLAPQMGYDAAIASVSESLQANSQLVFAKNADEVAAAKAALTAQKNMLERKIQNEGVAEGSEAHREYLNVLRNLSLAEDAEAVTNAGLGVSLAQTQSLDDLYNIAYQLDLVQDINNAAGTLAMKNASVELEVDQYAFEDYKQQNRINLEIVKAQFKQAQDEGGRVNPDGSITMPDVMSAVSAGAGDRGASLSEPAADKDWRGDKAAIEGYIKERDDMYASFILQYMSKENGGELPGYGNGRVEAMRYLEDLEKLDPTEKARVINASIDAIKSNSMVLYDGAVLEELESFEESIVNAYIGMGDVMWRSIGQVAQDAGQMSAEEAFILESLFDQNGMIVDKETFFNTLDAQMKRAYPSLLERQQQNGSPENMRALLNYFKQFRLSYAGDDLDPEKVYEYYDDTLDKLDYKYRRSGFNVHSYFDPSFGGPGGASRAKEVVKSYVLDPMRYYDAKKNGHENAVDGYAMLSSIRAGSGEDAFAFEGSLQENNYYGLDELNGGELKGNRLTGNNTTLKLIDQFFFDTNQYDKGTSTSRPTVILDGTAGIGVGDDRYVAVQLTFPQEYINKINDEKLLGNDVDDVGTQHTIYVPQNKLGYGYFSRGTNNALMSQVLARGEVTTQFPGGMGDITYTYDSDTESINVVGRIKTLDPDLGEFSYERYGNSTTTPTEFQDIRSQLWQVYTAAIIANQQALRELERANGVKRTTNPQNLK